MDEARAERLDRVAAGRHRGKKSGVRKSESAGAPGSVSIVRKRSGVNGARMIPEDGRPEPVRAYFLSPGVYIGTGNGVTFEPSKALTLLTPCLRTSSTRSTDAAADTCV